MILALGTLCCTGWALSELVEHSMRDTMSGLPIPYLTRLVVLPHGWLLVAPLPWLIWASILTLRREVNTARVLLFAGALMLFATLLACVLAVALVLPYIPRLA